MTLYFMNWIVFGPKGNGYNIGGREAMRKYLFFVGIAVLVIMPTTWATTSIEVEDPEADVLVPLPEFGACLWARENAPMFVRHGGKYIRYPNKLTCGELVYHPLVEGEYAYFTKGGHEYAVATENLTNDPRETYYWRQLVEHQVAKTMWSRVVYAARTEGHPDVTRAILHHMEKLRCVRRGNYQKMSRAQIDKAIADYSNWLE